MADDALQLRRLTTEDLPAYKVLRDCLLQAHPQAFQSDAETARAEPAIGHRGRLGTPAVDDGRFTIGAWWSASPVKAKTGAALDGAISCERDDRRKVQHIGHIIGMMVRPPLQGRGIGRALLGACIDAVRRAGGIELLTLSVTASNSAAIALYRRAGFVRYGTLPDAIRVGQAGYAKDLMVLELRARTGG